MTKIKRPFYDRSKNPSKRQKEREIALKKLRFLREIFYDFCAARNTYLNARTPQEVYIDAPLVLSAVGEGPIEEVESTSNSELPEFSVNISYFEGRKHLPIIEIKKAA